MKTQTKLTLKRLSIVLVVALLAAACAAPAAPATSPTAAPAAEPTEAPAAVEPVEAPAAAQPPAAAGMDELVAAAKAEGMLTVIALPHDWCNYGEMIDTFKAKYGIKVNELNPDAGSGDEIEAIKANKDNKGPQAPDVIDVGFSFGPDRGDRWPGRSPTRSPPGTASRTTSRTPMATGTATTTACWRSKSTRTRSRTCPRTGPTCSSRSTRARWRCRVTRACRPRPIMTVIAAALANGGSLDDVMPGLEFFKKLNEAGNFVPVIAKQATVAKGETPVDRALGLQRPGRPRQRWPATPRSRWSSRRPASWPASTSRPSAPTRRTQRRQAVDGIPVLRRGPVDLAQGLLPPDALQRPGQPAT